MTGVPAKVDGGLGGVSRDFDWYPLPREGRSDTVGQCCTLSRELRSPARGRASSTQHYYHRSHSGPKLRVFSVHLTGTTMAPAPFFWTDMVLGPTRYPHSSQHTQCLTCFSTLPDRTLGRPAGSKHQLHISPAVGGQPSVSHSGVICELTLCSATDGLPV